MKGERAYAARYDLRTIGKVSSVKDQGNWGTCWSFAACGSLESCLLPQQALDVSEDNMILASGFDPLGWTAGRYDSGGNIFQATAYLASWAGPVLEADDAYGDGITPSFLTPRLHVQDVTWYSPRRSWSDNDRIKYAVSTYGAAYIGMSWQGSSYGSSHYDPQTHAYYYKGVQSSNHGVLVVGWDDSYSATNFATVPPGDGAFIVKNSWGTDWGESGCFYVSYWDTKFGRTSYAATVEGAQPVTNHGSVYQYDRLGDVDDIGARSTVLWGANVFAARSDAYLTGVGFYAEVPGTQYQLYAGTSLSSLLPIGSGIQSQMGYHTVIPSTKPHLTAGSPFVVAVNVTTPGWNYPMAIEEPVRGYSSGASALPGQSYVSKDGTSWTDLASVVANTNVCIKAYTSDAVDTTAPTTTQSGISAPWTGAPVEVTLAAVDGQSGVLYTVYSLDGSAPIRGNALIIADEGQHTLSYYSVDSVGNAESPQSVTVGIDNTPPTTSVRLATAKAGKKVSLRFTVNDLSADGRALSPTAHVVILIKSSARVVRRLDVGDQGTNISCAYPWKCNLKKGRYRLIVDATDAAGNVQRTAGSALLTVR